MSVTLSTDHLLKEKKMKKKRLEKTRKKIAGTKSTISTIGGYELIDANAKTNAVM